MEMEFPCTIIGARSWLRDASADATTALLAPTTPLPMQPIPHSGDATRPRAVLEKALGRTKPVASGLQHAFRCRCVKLRPM